MSCRQALQHKQDSFVARMVVHKPAGSVIREGGVCCILGVRPIEVDLEA